MKATVNGMRYDTDAPNTVRVASVKHLYPSDFHWYEEGLYRTARGRWFLAGEGGPLSRYGVTTVGGSGKTMTGGQRLTPLSEDGALEWLEMNEPDSDAFDIYFAHLIEEA